MPIRTHYASILNHHTYRNSSHFSIINMTLELRPARDSDIRRLQEIQFLADPEDPRLFAFSPMAQGYAHAEAPTRQSSQEGRRDIAWTVVDPECHNEITSFGIWTVWRTEDEKRYTPRLGVHWPDEERTTVLAMALWAFMQLNRGFWIGAKAHIRECAFGT